MEMENWRGRQVERSCVGWLLGAAWVGSMMLSITLAVVCGGLVKDVTSLREEIHSLKATVDRHETRLPVESEEEEAGRGKEWVNTMDGSPLQRFISRRSRRNARSHIQNRPVTQLDGSGQNNGQYLTWRRPNEPTYINSYHYETVLAPNNSILVQGIKIKRAGIHFVFSQVAFNGRNTMTDISECGHEVVRIPQRGRPETIQKSIITQDGEGRWYLRHNMNGEVYPMDTHSTFGVFRLRQHDTLRVQISPYCRPFARISMNQQYTHFGAFLINELHG